VASSEVQRDEEARELEPTAPHELVLALRDLNRSAQQFLTSQARATNLGLSELMTLIRAAERDGVTPADGGRALGLRRSSMTALSDRLVQRRLIRRVPDARDRRFVHLYATAAGRRVLERALGPLLKRILELASVLDHRDREIISRFIGDLALLLADEANVSRPEP
jgi:DNA-binding MarR family transcriptional regulator